MPKARLLAEVRSFIVGALVLAVGCSSGQGAASVAPQAGAAGPTFPGTSWEVIAEPAAVGYRASGLAAVRDYLATLPTTAFMAVVGGRVLFSYGDLDSLSYLASARKSVLSMLYGKYVADGTVKLDRTLAQLGIDDRQPLSAEEKQATVADLLGARSGVFHPASNPGDNLDSAPPRGSVRPGTYYLYSNWDFNALGTIFEQETHRGIYDALEADLARPIQMEDWRREIHERTGDTTRSRHLAYHMVLSTRDMARLGLLMLREGRWRDRQVLPRDWVKRSTAVVTPSREMHPEPTRRGGLGYGYLWWLLEEPTSSPLAGAYSARGAWGQYILVVPKLDLVVAHKRAPERNGDEVGWQAFMGAVNRLIAARCQGRCRAN
jgi:CubicO group peptidase (beta-lactamase class C family)